MTPGRRRKRTRHQTPAPDRFRARRALFPRAGRPERRAGRKGVGRDPERERHGEDGDDGAEGSDDDSDDDQSKEDDDADGDDDDSDRDGDRRRGGLSKPRKPKRGRSVNAKPKRGKVKVRLPGSTRSVPLEDVASVPVGSVLDATDGAVTITAASSPTGGTQQATFSGAAFKLAQPKTAGVTDIRLRGGSFKSCRTGRASVFSSSFSPLAALARHRRPVRKIWGRGKGRFRTRGRHGAATVRGTIWMTADTCRGTLVRVKRGRVDVRDYARRKTVTVRAGKQYLAKKRAAKRR